MKKVIFSMIIGGVVGHIITKQKATIKSMKRDYERSGDAYLRGVREGLEKRNTRAKLDMHDHVGRRRSGRYPWVKNPDSTEIETIQAFQEIIIETRKEAENVLSHLSTMIAEYGTASVSDLYDLVGMPFNSYQNVKWGWTKLVGSHIIKTHAGYLINLPEPIKLP